MQEPAGPFIPQPFNPPSESAGSQHYQAMQTFSSTAQPTIPLQAQPIHQPQLVYQLPELLPDEPSHSRISNHAASDQQSNRTLLLEPTSSNRQSFEDSYGGAGEWAREGLGPRPASLVDKFAQMPLWEDEHDSEEDVGGNGDIDEEQAGDATLRAPPDLTDYHYRLNIPQPTPHDTQPSNSTVESIPAHRTLQPGQPVPPSHYIPTQPQFAQHISQFSVAAIAAQGNSPAGVSAEELNRHLTAPVHMV
jgi:hypothetical protein